MDHRGRRRSPQGRLRKPRRYRRAVGIPSRISQSSMVSKPAASSWLKPADRRSRLTKKIRPHEKKSPKRISSFASLASSRTASNFASWTKPAATSRRKRSQRSAHKFQAYPSNLDTRGNEDCCQCKRRRVQAECEHCRKPCRKRHECPDFKPEFHFPHPHLEYPVPLLPTPHFKEGEWQPLIPDICKGCDANISHNSCLTTLWMYNQIPEDTCPTSAHPGSRPPSSMASESRSIERMQGIVESDFFNSASGTGEKHNCYFCSNSVDLSDIVLFDSAAWHRQCFRCQYCNEPLNFSTATMLADGNLACTECAAG